MSLSTDLMDLKTFASTFANKGRAALLGATLATAILSIALVPMALLTGCDNTQQTIAALTETLGTAASSIASVEGNATLASKLQADTSAAVTAIDDWEAGSPADEAVEALNVVESDLGLFPGADQYAPLIDIAIATVQSILALVPQSAVSVKVRHGVHVRFVHLGYVPPRNSKSFKKHWNAVVKLHPAWGRLALQ